MSNQLTPIEALQAIVDCEVDGKLWDAILEMKQIAQEAIDAERDRHRIPEPPLSERVQWLKWHRAETGAGLREALVTYNAKLAASLSV